MKKNYSLAIMAFMVLFSICSNAQITEHANASDYSANKPEKLEWLQDAGFGMFIHFSHDSQLGVVIGHTLVGASDDYKDRFFNELPKTFEPSEFDAYKIGKSGKMIRMKCVVYITKCY